MCRHRHGTQEASIFLGSEKVAKDADQIDRMPGPREPEHVAGSGQATHRQYPAQTDASSAGSHVRADVSGKGNWYEPQPEDQPAEPAMVRRLQLGIEPGQRLAGTAAAAPVAVAQRDAWRIGCTGSPAEEVVGTAPDEPTRPAALGVCAPPGVFTRLVGDQVGDAHARNDDASQQPQRRMRYGAEDDEVLRHDRDDREWRP